jgi:hypothetical protein
MLDLMPLFAGFFPGGGFHALRISLLTTYVMMLLLLLFDSGSSPKEVLLPIGKRVCPYFCTGSRDLGARLLQLPFSLNLLHYCGKDVLIIFFKVYLV